MMSLSKNAEKTTERQTNATSNLRHRNPVPDYLQVEKQLFHICNKAMYGAIIWTFPVHKRFHIYYIKDEIA